MFFTVRLTGFLDPVREEAERLRWFTLERERRIKKRGKFTGDFF